MRPIRDGQRMLDALCDRLWPPQPAQPPRPRRPLSASDGDILMRAKRARNGNVFAALWAGHWRDRYGSHSEADLALCGLLAFWCNGDQDRVDQLFRQSGLCRPKWLEREYYRTRTLTLACTGGHA
ncbi:MAG: hypothetical protein ACRERC_15225 [Candidatus Binatia bacterium]